VSKRRWKLKLRSTELLKNYVQALRGYVQALRLVQGYEMLQRLRLVHIHCRDAPLPWANFHCALQAWAETLWGRWMEKQLQHR